MHAPGRCVNVTAGSERVNAASSQHHIIFIASDGPEPKHMDCNPSGEGFHGCTGLK
jgi:hypothetical protein